MNRQGNRPVLVDLPCSQPQPQQLLALLQLDEQQLISLLVPQQPHERPSQQRQRPQQLHELSQQPKRKRGREQQKAEEPK